MTEITRDLIQGKVGNLPLVAYPWKEYADRLILWAKGKSSAHSAFAFDVLFMIFFGVRKSHCKKMSKANILVIHKT